MKKHIHPCSGKTHWFSHFGPGAPYAFALAVALSLGNIAAFAQISIPNTSFTYTQDFNTLAASGFNNTAVPAGWAFFETSVDFSANTTYRAGDASGDYWQQTYETYSLGATGNSDRAFGSITSTGQDSLNSTIGACFTNNTGATITSLTVTYTGETWRVASQNRQDGLVFQYNQNTTGINGPGIWTAFSALNYFNPGDPTLGGGSIRHSAVVSATISGLNIAPGNTFCFRWLNFDATAAAINNPNQEDALGVDDFSLSNIVACPSATTLYVNQSVSSSGNGTSWATAFKTLQEALQPNCPSVTQIWVAQGTYYPDEGGSFANNDRNAAFTMKNGVSIYGGFSGNGTETMLSQRNLSTNTTILSGEIQQDNNISNNSYHVFNHINNGLNLTAVLDGFTITGGNADDGSNNTSVANGGGGMVNLNSSPSLNNVIFTGNRAFSYGGGLHNANSTSILSNVIFLGNQSQEAGGGMFTNSSPSLINVTFSGNQGTNFGGGLYHVTPSAPSLKNCILWGNSSSIPGSEEVGNQGGNPTYTNCLIRGLNPAGTGNLDGTNAANNPLFVSQPPVGLGTTGNLRLQACSPAIDAGTSTGAPATDILGNARVDAIAGGNTVDMGAYEYQSTLQLQIQITSVTSTPIICQNDGTITAVSSTPCQLVGTITYSINGVGGNTANTTGVFNGLPNGNYTVTVYDNGNPTNFDETTVTVGISATAPVVTAAATAALCNGGNGQITLTVASGTAPYDYVWDGPGTNDGSAPPNLASYTINPALPGTYAITATDANGCATTTSAIVTEPTTKVQGNGMDIADGDAMPSPSDHTDFGTTNIGVGFAHTFTIQNTGGAPFAISSITSNNTRFAVSGAPASVAANSSATFTVTFTPTVAGTQNATITVNNGNCVYDFAVTGNGACPAITINAPTITQPTCATPTGTIVVNATGSGALEYSINNGSTWQTTNTYGGQAPGNYNIKVRLQASPSCEATYASNPVMLTSPFTASTTTDTWTGCVSTDWAVAGNWADGSVPTVADDVVIPNTTNKPTILGGTAAVAKTVEVRAGTTLTIAATASLTVNGSKSVPAGGTTAFLNDGTVQNNGQLILGNISAIGGEGLYNRGAFNNNTGGDIKIDRSTFRAILNIEATFNNSGLITIGAMASVGQRGLNNFGATAMFNNNTGGEIKIDNATIVGLYNEWGTFTNAAKITIGATAGVGGEGINNRSTFNNNSGGTIQVDQTGSHAIVIGAGTFTNEAIIRIGSNAAVGGRGIRPEGGTFTNAIGGDISINRTSGTGITNFATFINSATLTIGNIAISVQNGILNQGTFTNNATGEIRIDRSNIWNVNMFTNDGQMFIGSVAPSDGILNTGAFFSNTAGATIQLDRVNRGLTNTSTFTNAGQIRMGNNVPLGERGLLNGNGTGTVAAVFNNLAGGLLQIDRTATNQDGITNELLTTFTNAGTVSIGTLGSIGGNGITNAGTISNSACATLTVFDNLNNSSTFTNAGLFTVNTTQTHTNTALTNNGILAYPQGNPIPNVTNNEIIIAPTTANDCDAISPAFGLGSPVDFTIMGIFSDEAATMSAGTYVTATNTFTPTTFLAEGTYTFYVKVMDGSGGCTRIVPWQLTTEDCCPATGAIWYVNAAAAPGGNGASWDCAFQDLQLALAAASSGHQIWVAAGTYKPTTGTDRNISFSMKDGVAIYGGFNGTESMLDERDWIANVTTLSGDIDGTADGTTGSGSTLNITGNGGNSYHVLSNSTGLTNTAILDGFTVSGGNANGSAPHNRGGGILNDGSGAGNFCSPTIRNCIFTHNNASALGGAIANMGDGGNCSPQIRSCSFVENVSASAGGAVYHVGSSTSIYTECDFSFNKSNSGGAMAYHALSPNVGTFTLTNCSFTGNVATLQGGAIQNGFTNSTGNRSLSLSGCVFMNNVSASGGGAFNHGYLYTSGNTPVDFTNCTFKNNQCIDASGGGGAAFMSSVNTNPASTATFTNCLIDGNRGFGAVNGDGGAILTYFSDIVLNNSTIVNNQSATTGGGISVRSSSASATIKNCILWNNTATQSDNNIYNGSGGSVDMEYTLIQQAACPANVTCGAGNLFNFDPLFVSSTDFHLQTCSPAVNTGSNAAVPGGVTTDLDNNTRIFGGTVDMGAYEFQAAPTPIVPVCQNQTVLLNNMGMATFSPALLSNGTTGCGTLLYTVGGQSTLNFTCADTGAPLPVTLTVTDDRGITATCSATITVVDNTAPSISCPATQTLALGANCTAALPNYTSLATTGDNCGVQGVTQSPAAGTTVSSAGDMTVTLTVTDINGLTNTCTFTVTKVDNTAPSITCPATQTLVLGSSCTAALPNYTSLAATGDNCGVQSVTQSPAAGTVVSSAGNMTVTLTVTDINGLTNTCTFTVTKVDNTPPSITCPATQTLVLESSCTAALPNYTSLATTGDNCGVQGVTQSPAAGTVVSSAGDMTVTLTVTDINGLTNTCTFTVTKVDNTPPSITCPATQTLVLGSSCTATLPNYTSLATTGDNCGVQGVTQSPAAGTVVSSAGDMTVTLTVTDINGLTNTCTFTVTKVDNTAPSITCPATQTLVLGSSCTAALPNYTSLAATGDNCGVQGVTQSPAAGTVVSSAGNMTVTLTVTDINGLTNTCTFTVTKVDNTAPSITCPATQTLVLGSSCTATLPNYTSLATTGDNCGVQGVTQSPAAGTTVSSAGNMTVTLTVTDINGLTNTCTFTVTKVDNTPPSITCPATQTLVLGSSCTAALPNYTSLATPGDNCGVQGVTQSPAAGTVVSSAGDMTVTLTVTDINGLTNTCTFTVTKVDNTPPSITCPATQTLVLGSSCTAALPNYTSLATPGDNCGVQGVTQSPAAGTVVSSAGDMTVTLTVTDINGLTNTCTFTVTKVDNTPPSITCPNTQTLVLGANCTAELPNYTSLATTGDNCGVQGVTQSPAAGTVVSSAGDMTVTLTVTDINGLTNTCTFTVTKVDNTAPSITCPATQTLVLGSSCTAALPNYTSLAATGDNCGVQSVTQSPAAGTVVSSAGDMTVTLTVTDINGLTNTCTFTVTKVDNTPPSITCPNTQTLVLGANCTAELPNYTSLATTGDNCGVQGVTQSPAAGTTVSSAGNMTVTLTVTDINGLTNTCTFTVTKVDNTPPSITCPNTQTLVLGANCTAELPNYTSLATTGDNCGVQGVTQSPAAGTVVSSAGDMTVTLTVTDINGLTNTCTFTVTKVDNTPPSITCPATQTLVLGSSCTAALPNYTSLAATGDNCGVQGVTQSPAAGTTVSSAGDMTVTLTVTDINGLTNTCTFTVTKVDNTPPSITCPTTQTLVLGSSCTATLPNYTSLATTGDNCGVQGVTQSPAAGTTVSSSGDMTVTLTVTDINGLTNSCTFTVTKVDNTPPTVQCFNQTLNFNGEESIALDADDLAEASDNCGVQSISLSPSSISAERVGQIVPVTVTVTDINGNRVTCTSNITVSGFPAGWSQQPGGAGCSGNNNNYNSGTGVWTATSTNCFYGPPYTSDATSFVQRTLCGDGSLTAQVTSISGSALGWAGIVMRESNAPGAKKAQLMTNLSSLHRREVRTTTNGSANLQQSASNGRYWLRITRAGNQFTMSVSANGTSWFLIGAQTIVMGNCIQMGLVATNYTANSTVTATFAGVSYTGSNAGIGTGSIGQRAESIEGLHSFEVYPNPTSGELNLDLTQYIGRSIRIETYSLEGKLLQFSEIEEVQTTVEQLNLRAFPSGMYLVKVKSAGLPDATRRIVINRN